MVNLSSTGRLLGFTSALALIAAVGCGDSGTGTGGGGSTPGGGGGDGGTPVVGGNGGDGGTPVVGGSGGDGGSGGEGGAPAAPDFEAQPVGTPDWEPVDFHMFSVEVGNQFVNLPDIRAGILPEPSHAEHTDLGTGPGAPHAGPYDSEIGDGVAAQGYEEKSTFDSTEGLLPNGIMATFMVVPTDAAPDGSSPDSASGPIIPNTLFPIEVTVSAYQDNVEIDGYGYSFSVWALNDPELEPPFDVDGHSHFPMFMGTVFDGLPVIPGTLESRVSMIDTAGEGWNLSWAATAE